MKTKPMNILILFLIIGFTAYLDSPYSLLNEAFSFTASQPVLTQPAEESDFVNFPDTQEKLVKIEKQGGYTIETYQEYEVYKDKNGNIEKEVPTSVYDELKYWDYQ